MGVLQPQLDGWALILGASSGFGAAVSRELAACGMNIIGVHLDRRNTQHFADGVKADIESHGRKAVFVNTNAADPEARAQILDALPPEVMQGSPPIRVVLHSLAFGTLKPFVHEDTAEQVTKAQMEMTLDVMANSLVYWVQDLMARKLLAKDSRIYAMTSSGADRIWPGYGPVGTAKACLESHIRRLAVELGKDGIAVNAIRAGVTDTAALRKIPGNDEMLSKALSINPGGRLTRPEDIAKAISALAMPQTYWLTGNIINVDGGEYLGT